MRYWINKLILIVISISMLISCVQEDEANLRQKEDVMTKIDIRTRATLYPDTPDDEISSLRVLAFDQGTQRIIRSNKYYPLDSVSYVIHFLMLAGTYDFVFIANEPSSGDIHTALNSISRWSDLNSIAFPATMFNSNDNIPMFLYEPNVTLLSDGSVTVNGGPMQSIWQIALRRLGVRFDMILKADTDFSSNFSGITFSNLPDNVPLIGNYSGTHTTSRTFSTTLPEDAHYFRDTIIPGSAWAKVVNRVILPSNVFSPVTLPERAINFSVQLNGVSYSPSGPIGFDKANNNYTLPENSRFAVNGTVKFPMEVNIDAADWGTVGTDGNMNNRILNVSSLTASITDRNRVRIYFSSNQPSVSVDPIAYVGSSGTTSTAVNNIFDNLSGPSAGNLNYNPATGLGYIDIAASFYGSLVANSSYTHRIYLNAGGLRREITISTILPVLPTPWSSVRYVGTFHRWNQTGERIIYSNNVGNWTATVVQGDFITLSSGRSFDPKLGTNNTPNNPENYPVTDGSTTVSGINRIFFRVGLTSTLASATSAPRYGLIRIDYTSGTSYIYVRQGEAPAVINSTVKWSPVNLSDPLRGTGGASIASHNLFTPQATVSSTTFADYPTHVGYMFQWNLYDGITANANRVFHPTNPSTSITGYPTGTASSWNVNNDPCPAGYRHPTGAEFATFAPDTGNSLWGFYADGFFDRRIMRNGANITGERNYEFGTYGRVFFNAATNASVFFPVAGNRISGGGSQVTSNGNYCTSDIIGSNANILAFTASSVTPNTGTYAKGRAFSVRCIQK